jgi:hypothetical protein
METIRQDILFHETRELALHRFSFDDAGISAAIRLVCRLGPLALGISVTLDPDGGVCNVALSTPEHVLLFSTRTASRGQGRLERLFCGGVVLVGFEMAKLALLLNHDLDCPVSGVDLSTLFAKSTMSPSTPAQLTRDVLHQDNIEPIRTIWTGDRGDHVSLRAFVCARYVSRGRSCAIIDGHSALHTSTYKQYFERLR